MLAHFRHDSCYRREDMCDLWVLYRCPSHTHWLNDLLGWIFMLFLTSKLEGVAYNEADERTHTNSKHGPSSTRLSAQGGSKHPVQGNQRGVSYR